MRPLELLAVYAVIGVGVALACRRDRWWAAGILWPLYLPALWANSTAGPPPEPIEQLRAAAAHAHVDLPLEALSQGLKQLKERRLSIERVLPSMSEKHPQTAEKLRELHLRLEGEYRVSLAGIDALTSRILLAEWSGQPGPQIERELRRLLAAIEAAREVDRL